MRVCDRVVLSAVLLAMSGLLVPVSAQLGISSGDGHFSYQWTNQAGIKQFDTLQFRAVEINTGAAPQYPRLECEIWTETDLALGEPVETCVIPEGPLEPGDSVWTQLKTVVRSPPGDYSLEWGVLNNGYNGGSFKVHESEAEWPRTQLGHRIPFVLELTGAGAADFSKSDFETLASRALTEGVDFMVLAFPVSKEAASAMESFAPVLFLSFDLDERGSLAFSRSWEGGGVALDRPRGLVSRGTYGSALLIGAAVHRLLLREGRYFGGVSR